MLRALAPSVIVQASDVSRPAATGLLRFVYSLLAGSDAGRVSERLFPLRNEELAIMPMGDSITAGTEPGGYRAFLEAFLHRRGYVFDLVGEVVDDEDPTRDADHWGKSGWGIARTDQLLDGNAYVSLQSNESSAGSIREGLYGDLERAISPAYFSTSAGGRNIILLMVGTNDLIHQVVNTEYGAVAAGDKGNDASGEQQDKLAESAFERLGFFLDEMDRQAGSSGLDLDVIIGTIPAVTDQWRKDPFSDVVRDEIIEYNGLIKDELPGRSDQWLSITVVDQFSAIGSSLSDGLHPDSGGYFAMAQAWLEGIEQVLIS